MEEKNSGSYDRSIVCRFAWPLCRLRILFSFFLFALILITGFDLNTGCLFAKEKGEPAWVYYTRGNFYRNRKDYGKAITMYERALRLDPNFVLARYALIDYYLNEHTSLGVGKQKYLRVNALLDDVIARKYAKSQEDNELAYYLYMKAKVCFMLDRRNQAILYCNKSLKVKQDFYEVWYFKGDVYQSNKSWQQAIEHYLRLIASSEFKKKPTHRAFMAIAYCYQSTGEIGKAFRSYEEALRLKYNERRAIKELLRWRNKRSGKNEENEVDPIINAAEYYLSGDISLEKIQKGEFLLNQLRRFDIRRNVNRKKVLLLKRRLNRLKKGRK